MRWPFGMKWVAETKKERDAARAEAEDAEFHRKRCFTMWEEARAEVARLERENRQLRGYVVSAHRTIDRNKGNGPCECLACSSAAVTKGREGRECRDGGKCHHRCDDGPCWREENCAPLSDYSGPWGKSDGAA